jgi:large conductance mechanosensitive channel
MFEKTREDFKKFIARGNVFDLAIGVVIGTAFGAITNSLVSDIIMPPVGYLTGGVDFSKLGIVLGDVEYESVAAAVEAGAPVIRYGAFIDTILNFLIIAAAMFLLVRLVERIKERREKEEADPASPVAPPRDIVLLTEIRDLLREGRGGE